MNNPLAIPEIIAGVVIHLAPRELATVSCVNKTWRLEARRKLYPIRSHIIYNFFKKYLNNLRLNRFNISKNLISIIPLQIFKRFAKFRHAFNLDTKVELLAIRDEFRAMHKKLKKRSRRLRKKADKEFSLVKSHYYSAEFWVAKEKYFKLYKKYLEAEEHRFEFWRDFVNYEYFLIRFGGLRLFTDQEIDTIIDKLQPLEEEEEGMRVIESANSIVEYWDDEDPDLI